MKIKGWIIWSLVALVATASHSLGAEADTIQNNFAKLESAIESAKDQVAKNNSTKKVILWSELQSFNALLWRAMALDPGPITIVPVNEVPKNLFAAELNQELVHRFDELKKSPYPKQFQVENEFNQYAKTVEAIIRLRLNRAFPQARAIAKRGALDFAFAPFEKKFGGVSEATENKPIPAFMTIEDLTSTLKEQVDSIPKEVNPKTEAFANGNKFIWYMVAAIFGFFFGIAGYRMNPDFFQKMLDQLHSDAPTATTHGTGATQLDYAQWLRELEEILSRLKSSQLTLERRIEGIVQNSEKISQHSLSLYADARIKNESNLEFRVSTLVREAQHQFDQSQKLQAGDRVQINMMLEHCLKLCDALEMNAIYLDRQKLTEQHETLRTA